MNANAALHHYASAIRAAERGDFCHGNGAGYVFVDRFRGTLVSVNVVTGAVHAYALTTPQATEYLASTPPHRDQSVADRLRAHVLHTYHVEV